MDEHIPREQLFALMHALRASPPPTEGEGADPELADTVAKLGEQFRSPLPPEHRLGPETASRLLAHARACQTCRCLLLEDGPAARPPKTAADVQSEVVLAEEQRKKKVIKFWTCASIGLVTFVGSQIVFYERGWKELKEGEGAKLTTDPTDQGGREIDPLLMLGVALILVAAWTIAESYVLARELWLDWTRLKAAVPVIGRRWAEKGKPKPPD